MRVRSRWLTALVGISALALVALPTTAGATDATQDSHDPSLWGTGSANPSIDGTAHTLRFFGDTRYNTNLATTLGMVGDSDNDFPFDTADRTDDNEAGGFIEHQGFWSGADCDSHGVIIVAGDVAADALAAASVADPSHDDNPPFLKRVAASDPSSDPIGGFEDVDLEQAPIILTRSGREGATALSAPARAAAQYTENCSNQDALIIGGPLAVPVGVQDDLISLGFDEVFRVDGLTRFDTARDLAVSLGTDTSVGACSDMSALDGDTDSTSYAQSVVEYRSTGELCTRLQRTVVLADGITGADAMASGWWTSYWGTPVLFTDAAGGLPPETMEGLETLDIDNLVVLGGTARIPDATVTTAAGLASAVATRVAGGNRYDTSVKMAEVFGGWYPSGLGDSADGSLLCLAAHGGDGAAATGWPDALSAGPFCTITSNNGGGGAPDAPNRALPPVNGSDPMTASSSAARDLNPVLLTAPGSSSLPTEVSAFLAGIFPTAPGDGTWCTGSNSGSCSWDPGFGLVLGGTSVIPDAATRQLATAVSGGTYTSFADHMSPTLADGFFTALDLSTVFTDVGDGGASRACFNRGGITNTQFLSVYDDATKMEFDAEGDVVFDNDDVYLADNDGVVRATPTMSSAPACVYFADDGVTQVPEDMISSVFASSLSGHFTAGQTFDYSVAKFTGLSGPVGPSGPAIPASSGGGMASDTDVDASTVPDATTTWTYGGTGTAGATSITVLGQTAPITSIALNVTLTRGNDSGIITAPDVVTGTFTITTGVGTVTGTFTGEALFTGAAWEIRGMSTVTGGTFSSGAPAVVPVASTGGFTASIAINGAGTADDTVGFQLDAIVD